MSRTATFDRFAPPDEEEAKVIAWCACGCDGEIVEGYAHYEMDGEWFYEEDCILRKLGAERRIAG